MTEEEQLQPAMQLSMQDHSPSPEEDLDEGATSLLHGPT